MTRSSVRPVGFALADQGAMVQHEDAVGEGEHHFHQMLDDQDGDAP